MSSRIDLRVSHSLELLATLRRTVTDFAHREEQLSRELLTRRAAENRKFRDASDKVAARETAEIAAAEARLQHERDRLTALYDGRRRRVERLKITGLRNLPKRASEEKRRWMGDLQMRRFHADRKHTADLATTDTAFAEFAAAQAGQQTALVTLDKTARRFFRGYETFVRLLPGPHAPAEVGADRADHEHLLNALNAQVQNLDTELAAFRRQFAIARAFSDIPLTVLVPLTAGIGVVLAVVLGLTPNAMIVAGIVMLGLLVILFGVHWLGKLRAKTTAGALAAAFGLAAKTSEDCRIATEARHARHRARIDDEHQATLTWIEEQWQRADTIEAEFEKVARRKIETQVPRVLARIKQALGPRLRQIAGEHATTVERAKREAASQKHQIDTAHQADVAALQADEQARWSELETAWQRAITPPFETIAKMRSITDTFFPPWSETMVETWSPNTEFLPATKFGELVVDLSARTAGKESRLALPGPPQVTIPLALTFPMQGSLLFETSESGAGPIVRVLENIMLRLLASTPPGKLALTIIDPVGLGQNFAGFMHLGDYEESLINRRIWTQRDQIEERLAELGEHIEKVIQMYLRNEYDTITEYNADAGSIAEKYHFLVLADFPTNVSEAAARRLQSIVQSGPRCGIFTLIHWDQRQQLPDGFAAEELRKNSISIRRQGREFILAKEQLEAGAALMLEMPPEPDLAASLIHRIGKSSIDSNRVEVPFSQIVPEPSAMWANDTTNELRIPIGRTGATKMQFLAIGKGTRQHALFAGKTGSGKSTLFHVIITNLALSCSPDQVEFYLIDFKKGVEFKCYASKRLPHARVVAIESDREFALSVLQRVDDELKRRGDLFRKLEVQDLAGYKKAGGTEPMPRSLLLIDEFQEFFVEDDAIAQTASLLFDRIVRQGRAFGIHVLLGSQSLGGAYSLARATLGQMVIRVALQCNEADAYLIMDDSNAAPRLLSRPGEGIYNDAGGALEGNSPFQVVWLPDDERDRWLDKVHTLAEQKQTSYPNPIVFEGNAPADIRENDLLRAALESGAALKAATDGSQTSPTLPAARCWLGAPNSIKGPTEAVFQRQSGNHLLIVGQREDAALTLLSLSLLALAAQHPIGSAKFFFFHQANPGSPEADFLDRIIAAVPHAIRIVRAHEVAHAMNEIAAEMKSRGGGETIGEAPTVFVLIHGLHKFKKLRHEDDFSFSSSGDDNANPGAQLNDLICEGSSLGLHLLVSIDNFNNVNRAMSRKALSEFEMRVVFQMSANDSASLIDNPKASNLGLHRALFYNEHEGTLETFRPYATPDAEWIAEVAKALARPTS